MVFYMNSTYFCGRFNTQRMVSREAEKMIYKAIYELAFNMEAHFFYSNDTRAILAFLKENYWGESLEIRVTLLSKLLGFDAEVNPPLKKELKKKSNELKRFLTSLPPNADPPFSEP